MSEVKKRVRVFAGPNGSGKTTLFEAISKKYSTGYFINADNIEKLLDDQNFVDLEDYNIAATQDEFFSFCKKNAVSLFEKSANENHAIDLKIVENCIIDASSEFHTYEGSLISAFLREKLLQSNQSFCFETVMSHPSKLEDISEAKHRGYKTYLYFILY